MFENYREWIRFYINAKYQNGFAWKVFRKQYEAYLKRYGYEDKHLILR